MPTPPQAPAPTVEAYTPATPIAASVARYLDENPPTVPEMCGVANALGAPVERLLIGDPR